MRVLLVLFEDIHFSLGLKHIHGVKQDVMLGDTGNISLILGESSIVDGYDFFPICLGLAVEIKRGGNLALKKVENSHSSISFYRKQVNAWSTCADIDHRIVQLNALHI